MKTILRLSLLAILCVLIGSGMAGCETAAEPRPTICLVTSQAATATSAPVQGGAPRATRTPSPSDTPEPEAAPTYTPTLPPTPAPTPEPRSLALPEWAAGAEVDQFLLTYQNKTGSHPVKAGLVNAVTGEEAEIDLGQEFSYSYWKDPQHIVFLHGGYCVESPKVISELDLTEGVLSLYDPQEHPELVRDCDPEEDGQIVRPIENDPEHSLGVVEAQTGRLRPLTEQNDWVVDIAYWVSPDQAYAAVLQSTERYDFTQAPEPPEGDQISIYRLHDRVVLVRINAEGGFSTPRFFPDSKQLIYMWNNTPCVIGIPAQAPKCLMLIPGMFPTARIYLGEVSADAKKLWFMYMEDNPQRSGLCYYDLFSGVITCPTDMLEALSGQQVIDYALSPDGEYALLVYSDQGCPRPWCSEFGTLHLALIDAGGTRMIEMRDTKTIYSIFASSNWAYELGQAWRPAETVAVAAAPELTGTLTSTLTSTLQATGTISLPMVGPAASFLYLGQGDVQRYNLSERRSESLPLPGQGQIREAALSPDGRWLAYHDEGGLKLSEYPFDGLPVTLALTQSLEAHFTFSGESGRLAYADEMGLKVYDLDQGSAALVLRHASDRTKVTTMRFYYPLNWSPNGEWLWILAARYEGSTRLLSHVSSMTFYEFTACYDEPVWLADSRVFFTTASLSESQGCGSEAGVYRVDIGEANSVSEKRIYEESSSVDAWVHTLYDLQISPDGARMLFAQPNSPAEEVLSRLLLIDQTGMVSIILDSRQGSIAAPRWSADGSRIYYTVQDEAESQVVSLSTETYEKARLAAVPGKAVVLADLPGSDWLVVGVQAETGSEWSALYLVNVLSGEVVKLSELGYAREVEPFLGAETAR